MPVQGGSFGELRRFSWVRRRGKKEFHFEQEGTVEALGGVPLEGENTGEEGYHRYQSVRRKKTANLCQKQLLTKIFPDLSLL
ncbi:hypothetical protein LC605_03915 [Nostoc sp. CHAB 5836]|uniref:hypothetical protein n=1 Tax=Nostoc sp. CHAB 5836 TaxID=2780404 RepID=UPI001E2D3682|nr:hypothetical protein [Nostoc sp. CHAB 5836]MCC5614235.1 hypothetical protein [Nostoc sp. CHAB 5836]